MTNAMADSMKETVVNPKSEESVFSANEQTKALTDEYLSQVSGGGSDPVPNLPTDGGIFVVY